MIRRWVIQNIIVWLYTTDKKTTYHCGSHQGANIVYIELITYRRVVVISFSFHLINSQVTTQGKEKGKNYKPLLILSTLRSSELFHCIYSFFYHSPIRSDSIRLSWPSRILCCVTKILIFFFRDGYKFLCLWGIGVVVVPPSRTQTTHNPLGRPTNNWETSKTEKRKRN